LIALRRSATACVRRGRTRTVQCVRRAHAGSREKISARRSPAGRRRRAAASSPARTVRALRRVPRWRQSPSPRRPPRCAHAAPVRRVARAQPGRTPPPPPPPRAAPPAAHLRRAKVHADASLLSAPSHRPKMPCEYARAHHVSNIRAHQVRPSEDDDAAPRCDGCMARVRQPPQNGNMPYRVQRRACKMSHAAVFFFFFRAMRHAAREFRLHDHAVRRSPSRCPSTAAQRYGARRSRLIIQTTLSAERAAKAPLTMRHSTRTPIWSLAHSP